MFREIGQPLTAEQTAAFKAVSLEAFAMFVATIKPLVGQEAHVRGDIERLAADTWRNCRAMTFGKSLDGRQRSVGLSAAAIYVSHQPTITN